MLFLFGKIILWLAVAALLGIIIGWQLKRLQVEKPNAEEIKRLERENEALRSKLKQAFPQKDDLTRIRGIGPILQARLYSMGIISVRQIAAWDDREIAAVAQKIGPFPERIQKDNWVEQARSLTH